MKKFLASVLMALFLVTGFTSQPANAAITAPCTLDGSGTQADPWKIGTATDLTKVGLVGANECVTSYSRDTYYKLTANIALTGNFTPVELYVNPGNTASFDGNGKTISGLKVVDGTTNSSGSTKKKYAGLFSDTRSAIIQNLNVTGESVLGDTFVGGLVGFAQGTTISNVSVTLTGNVSGDINSGIYHGQMVGGLVGEMTNSSITDSSFKSTAGAVYGTSYIGGAIGALTDSTATRISVSSDVIATNISGGVIGTASPNANLTMDQMFYSGSFTGDQYVGGIIGYLWSAGNYSFDLTNSATRGTLTTTGNYSPSAFIGHVGSGITIATVSKSYSTAAFRKNSSTSLATANAVLAIEGSGILIASENLYENWGAGTSMTGATLVADGIINELNELPNSWTAVQQDESVEAVTTAAWVIDGSTSPLNGGRPMPAVAYNTGFFANLQCAPGRLSDTGNIPCSPAEIGRYVALPGQTVAVDCPAGTYQPQAGQMVCLQAPAGYFVANAGSNQATPCASGYTSSQGATACTVITSSSGGSTVVVAKPLLSSSPKLIGVVAPGKTIALNAGTWTSTTPIQYSYTWYRCSHPVTAAENLAAEAHCVAVEKANEVALPVAAEDTKKFITALVTATNSGGSATYVASSVNSKTVKYLALASPAKLSGTAKVGQALSVASLKWIAASPTKTSYQWYRCDSARVTGATVGAGCKVIYGATARSYKQVSADKSKYVTVKVSAVLGSSKVTTVAGSAKKTL